MSLSIFFGGSIHHYSKMLTPAPPPQPLLPLHCDRMQREYPGLDLVSLFLHISFLGTFFQGVVVVVTAVTAPFFLQGDLGELLIAPRSAAGKGEGGGGEGGGTEGWSGRKRSHGFGLVVLNGVTFYSYLLMSWLVLSRVSIMTHSVMNAMRLPVVSFFGWLQFRNAISHLNLFGLVLASVGTPLFHAARLADTRPFHSS